VIGTGSSGIQSIPVLARHAAYLTVFQRHPQFTVPAFNGALAPETLAEVKSGYPDRREAMRKTAFGVVLPIPEKKALEVDEETRQTVYERGWQRGSLNGVIGAFKDLIFNREANETAAQFVREKIRSIVADPDLVDLRKDSLVRLTADGVETESGHHRLDLLVLATGFDAMTGALTAIDPVGVDGVPLRATWADGAHTYLGLMVAGYPNLFTVTGPGSPSVFANMIVAIEQHGNWIGDCLVRLRDHGLRRIEADVDAERAWMIHVDEVARPRLRYKTNSWYSGANIEGKPRVFLPYAGGLNVYGEKIDAVAANGYEGFHLS
jgi:cation diffusion facilitator CzcD-associated flavoprotein CzcO